MRHGVTSYIFFFYFLFGKTKVNRPAFQSALKHILSLSPAGVCLNLYFLQACTINRLLWRYCLCRGPYKCHDHCESSPGSQETCVEPSGQACHAASASSGEHSFQREWATPKCPSLNRPQKKLKSSDRTLKITYNLD